jgi:hypothetical protein
VSVDASRFTHLLKGDSIMLQTALNLLAAATPTAHELPARVEQLNICSFNLTDEIVKLSDEASRHEEEATAEAANESNADKRKAKRAEVLRQDGEYFDIKSRIRAAEAVKFQVDERSARLRREFRWHLATIEKRNFE